MCCPAKLTRQAETYVLLIAMVQAADRDIALMSAA